MSRKLVQETNLQNIAAAIRAKNGSSSTYKPREMADAIRALPSAGTLVPKAITENGSYSPQSENADGYSSVTVNVGRYLGDKSITRNGTFRAASDHVDGYSSVSVNVPNSYSALDEGKVVSSGTLTPQTSLSVTQNGTFDTTRNNQVTVSVSGGDVSGSSTLVTKTITENGRYDPADDNADGYSSVTVNVRYSTGNRLIADWDFTHSLTDEVGRQTAVMSSNLVDDPAGIKFTAASQYVTLTSELPLFLPDRSYRIMIDEMNLCGDDSKHYTLFSFGTSNSNNGLLYRVGTNYNYWSFYNGSWQTGFLAGEKNYWDGKELGLYTHPDGTVQVYADGVLVATSSYGTAQTCANMHLGNGRPQGTYGQCFNTTISRVRVYYGNCFE